MGNSNSFMEKVYIYLPIVMFHSRMNYNDPNTMTTMRVAYFAEQVALFASLTYFVMMIRARNDTREIFVPDISSSQILMNNVPKPEDSKFKRTTYFNHEMTQAFQQLQQNFVAFMLTLLVHFIAGIRPILLLQIFSTPYNFIENRLFRKYILGLQSGYRVWGEMFDGELEASQIPEGSEAPDHAMAAGAVSVPEGVVVSSADGTDRSVPVATVQVVQTGSGEPAVQASADSMPMPKALEDALVDAWDAGDDADWNKVYEKLGPFSVNAQTPAGKWSPLMVACGLAQVTNAEVKKLVSDLEARVDLQDEDGWTCAHWAAQHGRAGALRAVIDGMLELASEPEAGTAAVKEMLSVRDQEGKLAADIAQAANHEEEVLRELLRVLEGDALGTMADLD